MIGFLIYVAFGMLTLFLLVVQTLREKNAGGNPLKIEDRNNDKHDEDAGALWPVAALFLWPICLPMVLACLLLWKPSKVEVAQ